MQCDGIVMISMWWYCDSAHDSRVLNDAFVRLGGFSIPDGIIRLLHLFSLLV